MFSGDDNGVAQRWLGNVQAFIGLRPGRYNAETTKLHSLHGRYLHTEEHVQRLCWRPLRQIGLNNTRGRHHSQ